MSTETNDTNEMDRFGAEIYDLDLWDEETIPGPDSECTPTEHAGRPAFVFAIGPHGQDVRKVKMCTECNMALEELAYDDVHGLMLEGPDGLRDRVHNYPGETRHEKIPLEDIVDVPEGERVVHMGLMGSENDDGEVQPSEVVVEFTVSNHE